MRKLWTTAVVPAPAPSVWSWLADAQQWNRWGPSVRDAQIDGGVLRQGATGTVRTVGGLRLRFAVTDVVPGRAWSWRVGGLEATDHMVDPVDDHTCRVGFGVPLWAAPYLVVCRLALSRLVTMGERERVSA